MPLAIAAPEITAHTSRSSEHTCTPRPPSPRELEILAAVQAQTRLRGYGPTQRELGAALGLSGSWVGYLLGRLCSKRLIEHVDNQKRALYVTAAGHEALAARRFLFIAVAGGQVERCA